MLVALVFLILVALVFGRAAVVAILYCGMVAVLVGVIAFFLLALPHLIS